MGVAPQVYLQTNQGVDVLRLEHCGHSPRFANRESRARRTVRRRRSWHKPAGIAQVRGRANPVWRGTATSPDLWPLTAGGIAKAPRGTLYHSPLYRLARSPIRRPPVVPRISAHILALFTQLATAPCHRRAQTAERREQPVGRDLADEGATAVPPAATRASTHAASQGEVLPALAGRLPSASPHRPPPAQCACSPRRRPLWRTLREH